MRSPVFSCKKLTRILKRRRPCRPERPGQTTCCCHRPGHNSREVCRTARTQAWAPEAVDRFPYHKGRPEREELATRTVVGIAGARTEAVNIVVAVQSHGDGSPILDKNGKDISRTDYVTSLAPGRHGGKVRGFYRGRWGIENQGFRSLSQTWDIDRPAAHSYGAVLARLVFVFLIYNARHLLEKQSRHSPDYAEQLRQMRTYGAGISLAGASIVALTASGFCCALTARELLQLQKQRLLKKIERGLAAGKSVKEVMREIDNT